MRRSLTSLIPVVTLACKPGDDPHGPPQDAADPQAASLYLHSSNLSSSGSQLHADPGPVFRSSTMVPCSVVAPDGTADGLCLTPSNITGHATIISLSNPTGGPPIRLMGAAGEQGSLYYGLQPFDLRSPTAMAGTDQLAEAAPGSQFSRVSVTFADMDISAHMGERPHPYWTVRMAFVPIPLTADPTIDACIDDEHAKTRTREQTDVFSGQELQLGDVLLCQRDDDGPCDSSEFQWLDLDSSEFSATRPVHPFQLAFKDKQTIRCEKHVDSPGYDLDPGGYGLPADLVEPVTLSAEYQRGTVVYRYDPPDGPTVEGTDLSILFDFDLSQAVFLANVTDASPLSDAALLQSLTLQPLYKLEHGPEGDGYEAEIAVRISVDVTGEVPTTASTGWEASYASTTGDVGSTSVDTTGPATTGG